MLNQLRPPEPPPNTQLLCRLPDVSAMAKRILPLLDSEHDLKHLWSL